jgi:O-antigen ligase
MNYNILNKRLSFLLILLAFSLPISITFSEALYAIAFIVWLIKVVSQGKKSLRYTGLEIPGGIVLGIVYILAILFSPSPLESAEILKKFILLGLLPLIANSLNSEIEKNRLINVWLLGATMASIWTIIEYFRGTSRPGGFFGCITFGHFALMFLGVSLSLIGLKNYKRTFILSVLIFIVGIFALFLTFTRGAWIGFIVGLVLFFIIKRKWLFLATSTVALILIVSVLFIYFPNSEPGKAVRSLLQPFDKQAPRVVGSNLRHWYKWKASWMMFTEHPLFGVGPYQFEKELPNYLSEEVKAEILEIFEHRSYGHAHSIYFDYLATMGIIGFSALLFFFYTIFRLLISKYRSCDSTFEKNLVLGVLIAVVSFCIGGLTHQSFNDSEILLNLCFLLGLVL